MLKANFSFGGKLLLVLVTVIVYTFVLVAGIIGGALYAYNNVKVGDLLNLIQQSEWVSEEYAQKTIQEFVSSLQEDLSGEGLTLQTVIDISPKAGEMLDGLVDNLNENGIVTIDREELYRTPVQELSSSLANIAIVTASFSSLEDSMGLTLPDLPVIAGGAEEEIPIYTHANDTEDGSIDKAFTYGGQTYTYYTKGTEYAEATQTVTRTLYKAVAETTEEDGYVKAGGSYVYRRTETQAENGTAQPVYTRVRTTSSVVYLTDGGEYRFTANSGLYVKTAPGDGDAAYTELTYAPETETATGLEVLTQYCYQPLYAKAADGTYTPATADAPGSDGRYEILEGFENQTLYAETDVYTEVPADQLENGIPKNEFTKQNAVYVRSNGIAGLPLINGFNALSGVLDMDSLSLRKAAEYFGISLESDLLADVLDVPLAYLGEGIDSAVQGIELGSVLGLDADSDSFLLYLAYGEEGIDYTIEDGKIVSITPPRTISEVEEAIDGITIGDVVGESSHPLMQAISGWTLDDLADPDKINSLTIGDIMDLGDDPSPIMEALKNVALDDLPDTINSLTLEQMLGEIDESDSILYALKDCTLNNMAAAVQALSLQDLFAEDMYEYVYIGTKGDYDTRYQQLFVIEDFEYTEVKNLDSVAAGTKLYARYILAYDGSAYTDNGFRNIPLYAYEGGEYVLATEVSAWKLPALPSGVTEADLFAMDANGNYVAPVKDANGNYTVSTLYYLDGNDKTAELPLIPAQLTLKAGYEAKVLYSKYLLAQKAVVGGAVQDYYTQANLYYFDFESQSFERFDGLTEVLGDNGAAIGYRLPADFTGTVYTHGDVQGIWKYMLTNENGTEEIASLNDIGTLMSNITYNINNKSLRDMRDDGVLDVRVATGADDPLAEEIPEFLLDEADRPGEGEPPLTLGDLSISDLLNLTVRALQYLNNPSTIPTGGNT